MENNRYLFHSVWIRYTFLVQFKNLNSPDDVRQCNKALKYFAALKELNRTIGFGKRSLRLHFAERESNLIAAYPLYLLRIERAFKFFGINKSWGVRQENDFLHSCNTDDVGALERAFLPRGFPTRIAGQTPQDRVEKIYRSRAESLKRKESCPESYQYQAASRRERETC